MNQHSPMFIFRDIHQYQQELTAKNTTCVEAVQYYLQQIDANKKLNAFTEVFAAEALQQAAILDEKRKAGQSLKKLHGVVIAIKDVLCYKDHQTC
jgi:aspartyl-tRNA(Asn)/glutamyl-tRNA(Gln) amidotransferase subunit A